ncbi:MAG: hypothetical protein VW547_15175 [Alphaproteobacteria bacterium]
MGTEKPMSPPFRAEHIGSLLRPQELIDARVSCVDADDLVADRLFNEVNADCYFLEYDSPRAGDFSPLKMLPKNKTAVLGLVSTKTAELESSDELKKRIEEASKFTDLDKLAMSPQCGFASDDLGNMITLDDQIAKLKLVVDSA